MIDSKEYQICLNKIQAEKQTLEDVGKLTYSQACEITGSKEMTIGFFANLKRKLQSQLQFETDEKAMQYLKAQLSEWLDEHYPNSECERGRDIDKPFVKVWLEGKPAESEVENG